MQDLDGVIGRAPQSAPKCDKSPIEDVCRGTLPRSGEPCVSVIMSVHNGEAYLTNAVNSILNQTFDDFEFIIIDDGSLDRTKEILDSYTDHRIVRLYHANNRGMGQAYNEALKVARGEYVAMQDADDVSLSDRLLTQVDYLRQHPEIGVVGSAFYESDAQGEIVSLHKPNSTDTALRWYMLFVTPLLHGSIMYRRCLVEGDDAPYEASPPVEDYEFLTRLFRRTRAAGLEKPLYIYRRHQNSVCADHGNALMPAVFTVSGREINGLLPQRSVSIGEVAMLHRITSPVSLDERELSMCVVMLELFRALATQQGVDARVVRRLRREWAGRVLRQVAVRNWRQVYASGFLAALLRHDPRAFHLILVPELFSRIACRLRASWA